MSDEKKDEEKEGFLKKVFKGKVLDGYVEASKTRTLTEIGNIDIDIEEKRKKLLERVNKVKNELEEERRK